MHTFRIQGNRWNAEPSYPNSGFRDVQGFAISEHFEMLFQLPPGDRDAATPFADFLYAPSTSTMGLIKGSWGVMRSYKDKQKGLAQLPNNRLGNKKNQTSGFYKPPANAKIRKFAITAKMDGKTLLYEVNGKSVPTLVLRANAGDWIEITVDNQIPQPLPASFMSSSENPSVNYSSDAAKPYLTSSQAGLHPMLLSYDSAKSSGMNVGMNKPQTVPSGGKPRTSTWYAGAIEFKNGKRKLTPIEFGGVNLWPSD